MLKSKTFFWVGLVFVLGAVAFWLALGPLQESFDDSDGYQVYGIFDDASGLVERSRVTLSGIPVGQIASVRLDEEQPTKARVTLLIKHEVKLFEGLYDPKSGRWLSGASARRVQASLLGDYHIAISPGVAGKQIQPGGEIRNIITESGLGAVMKQLEESSQAIFPKLEEITADIQAITGSVRGAIGDEEGVAKLKQIRDDVARTTDHVAGLAGELRGFMKGEIYPEGQTVRNILRNVEGITERIRGSADTAGARLDRIFANLDGMSADLRRFIGDQTAPTEEAKEGTIAKTLSKLDKNMSLLEGTLENVQSVTSKIDQGKGTVGRLLNDDKLIRDFERIVSDVGEFTGSFSRLQVDVEFRSEYMFGQAALKHYLSVAIRPKPDKYWFFQIVDDPRGKVSTTQRVTTSNDPTKPPTLVENITTTTGDFKFTAQFAKRWHFLTLRYGIMESTGGWGLDVNLLEDALRFKLDVFDFGFERLPRVRLLAAWEFARYIYIAGGVDDILNNDGRDFFLGLGVKFTDNDIKSALPLLPF